MNSLSALTTDELEQVADALDALDAALEMLLIRGGADEDEGLDLLELAEAVEAEREARTLEDASYKVNVAVAQGEVVPVIRPDGAVGYMPTNE